MPSKSQMALQASGKWSVRKPPPFSRSKMPVKPHSCPSRGPKSRISTTSRSPGMAGWLLPSSTRNGPLRLCTCTRQNGHMLGVLQVAGNVVMCIAAAEPRGSCTMVVALSVNAQAAGCQHTRVRSMFFISSAESSSLIWPPVQS